VENGSIHIKGRDVIIPLCTTLKGHIVETNNRLLTHPGLINSDPFNKGWLIFVRPTHLLKDLQALYYGPPTEQWYRREVARLHASISQIIGLQESRVGYTMQDGGTPLIDQLNTISQKKAQEIIRQFLTPSTVLSKTPY
jgi:hypothetical protein